MKPVSARSAALLLLFTASLAAARFPAVALALPGGALATDLAEPSPQLRAALIPPPATGEHPARRFEVLFFIALPFSILFSTAIPLLLNQAMGLRAAALTGAAFNSESFTAGWNNAMAVLWVRSDVLFIGINSVLWSGSIALNDYLETREAYGGEKLRRAMDANRIDLTLLRLAF